MARTYKRDSRGRFAGGGGGGGGGKGKAASSRATNTARAKALQAAGTTAIGGRVKAKGFAGGKGAQQRAGGLRQKSYAQGSYARSKSVKGAGTRKGLKVSAANVAKNRSKAATAGKKLKKTSKAPVSAAKARYKQLSGKARRASVYASPSENRKAAGAKRSLAAMIKKRGR